MRAALLLLSACQAASSDPGLEAALRLVPGQFVPGPAAAGEGGPSVTTIEIPRNQVRAGEQGLALRGFTDPAASAVAVQLRGDAGHWILTTGLPDPQVPDQLTYAAAMSLAPDLESGSADLMVIGVDREGRHGTPSVTTLTVTAREIPAGELVVSLEWDTQADLDLRVVDPNGVTIWSGDPNSWDPPLPGEPSGGPDAWMTGGILDHDSNADCVIDGRRQENVVWTQPPPAGAYTVYVDTFSLCGEPSARWAVRALRAGVELDAAQGLSLDTDVRGGTRAFAFTTE